MFFGYKGGQEKLEYSTLSRVVWFLGDCSLCLYAIFEFFLLRGGIPLPPLVC